MIEMDNINKVAIAEWVAALRSGKYHQTGGTLTRVEDGVKSHCCLGVLCELAADKDIVKRYEVDGFPHLIRYDYAKGKGETMPPAAVESYSGLGGVVDGMSRWVVKLPAGHRLTSTAGSDYPTFFPDDEVGLADLNDTYGLSFAEIADLIEYTYLTES